MNIKFNKNIGLFLILSVFLSINLTNNSLSQVVAMKIDSNANISTKNGIYNKMINNGSVIYAQYVGSKILYTGEVKIMDEEKRQYPGGIKIRDQIGKYPIINVYNAFNYSTPLPKGTKKMWRLKTSSLDLDVKPTQIKVNFINNNPRKFPVNKSGNCDCDVVFKIPRMQGGPGNWARSSYTDLKDVPSKLNGKQTSHMKVGVELIVVVGGRDNKGYGELHYLELQEFNVLIK